MKNYQYEEIPELVSLTKEVLSRLKDITVIPKYAFTELFKLHERGFYEKNTKIFSDEIKYNVRLKETDKKLNEIQGVYVFFEDGVPVYAGISRKLIRRLRNHFLGRSHFEASLVYLMARDEYDKENGLYMGTREKFPFNSYRPKMQENMIKNWEIAIIPELDNYKLYYLEFALACKLNTKWNSFTTH